MSFYEIFKFALRGISANKLRSGLTMLGILIGGVSAVTKDVIPFGSVWGVHAHLEGLNLVGLKRRGFSRESINDLRAAYRLLFAEEGTFQERLDDVAQAYSGVEHVMEIVNFIRADASRPLCLPTA